MYITINGYESYTKRIQCSQDLKLRKSATYNSRFCNAIRGLRLNDVNMKIRELRTVGDIDNLQGLLNVLKECFTHKEQ